MSLPRLRPKWAPVVRCATCDTPYVLRLTISLAGRQPRYTYFRDCKHKTPPERAGIAEVETAIVDAFATEPKVAS